MKDTLRSRPVRAALAAMLLAAASLAHAAGPFTVESAEIAHKGRIADAQVFNGFGCEGTNVSPSLAWKNPPPGTQSFAITMFDPDAPTGSGWWHWVVFNLPASATSLPAGAGDPSAGRTPKGAVQSRTDFGKPGYGGPCPPKGDKPHRYVITVHALKVPRLDLDESAPAAMVGFMVNANRIGKASLSATYGRK